MQNNKQRVVSILSIMGGIVVVGVVIWAIMIPRPVQPLPTIAKKHVVGLQVGEKAPAFSLLTSGGSQVHLSDFLSQPVVMLFSENDCSSCEMQLSVSQRVYAEQYRLHQPFALLGIDLGDTAASVMHYDSTIQSPDPITLTQPSSVGTLYHITGVPTSVFIDRTGMIRAIVKGEMDTAMLQQYVLQILKA